MARVRSHREWGYLSVSAAKRGAKHGKHRNPVIAFLGSGLYEGRYNWFPADEPLPKGATVASRWDEGCWRDTSCADE